MRTIIDIPEDQLAMLAAMCETVHISRAEAIRRAIALYLQSCAATQSDEAFGLWKDKDIESVDYQRALRSEWRNEGDL